MGLNVQRWNKEKSSVECKKVVSAFLSFCGKAILCSDFLCISLFLTTYFVHKNVNTLSWDLSHSSKCVILHALSISITNSISPKMSLTTFLHSHDEMLSFSYSDMMIIILKYVTLCSRNITLCDFFGYIIFFEKQIIAIRHI